MTKNFTFFLGLGLILSLLTGLIDFPFMADDWERIYAIRTDNIKNFLQEYYYRFYFHGLLTEYLFPIFLRLKPSPTYLLFWFSLILSSLFYFSAITKKNIPELVQGPGSYLILLAFLFPNNHEWIFFPSVLIFSIVITLMSFSFWFSLHKNKLPYLRFIFALVGLYTYESLLFMHFLFEILYLVYNDRLFERSLKIKSKLLFPLLSFGLIAMGLKYSTTQLHLSQVSQPENLYKNDPAFKLHLFKQFLSLSFLHDYYKTRWATSLLSLLFISTLFFDRLKTLSLRKFLKQDSLVIFTYILASSYYFFLMSYSSRRALAGQLFFWSFFLCFLLWSQIQNLSKRNKILQGLFFLSFFSHFVFIVHQKKIEKKVTLSNIKELEAKLVRNDKKTLVADHELTKNLPRGWNFVNPVQKHAALFYYLGEEIYSKKVVPLQEERPSFKIHYPLKPFVGQ